MKREDESGGQSPGDAPTPRPDLTLPVRRKPGRRRSPAEDKLLSYERDRRNYIYHSREGSNHTWPRKRARSHRKYRRQVRGVLSTADTRVTADDLAEPRPELVRRDEVKKWGTYTLREWVNRQHQERITSTAWNYFKTPYNAELHRKRFAAFLSSLVDGRTAYSREVAQFLKQLLDRPAGKRDAEGATIGPYWRIGSEYWLYAFFADEPDWETRLRAWIERMTSEE